MVDFNLLNGISLAYIGDAVYELIIREYFINEGLTKVNTLHNSVVKFTKGETQAKIIRYLLDNNKLKDDEISVFKRGRNSHVNLTRKNISLSDYHDATGFEALVGYLYLKKDNDRLRFLVNDSINYILNLKEVFIL